MRDAGIEVLVRRIRGCVKVTGFAQLAWFSLLLLIVLPSALSATWSIIAVNMRTGRVVISSATCVAQGRLERFPANGLMDI